MISPKLAVLMAAFALVGAITVPTTALAQDDESQNAEVDIERNNEIEQSIEQSQEACTNEAEVSVSDDDEEQEGGVNSASVSQSNDCDVTQDQDATNAAAIVDASENVFDITTAVVSDDELVPNCPPPLIFVRLPVDDPELFICVDPNLTMNPLPDFP